MAEVAAGAGEHVRSGGPVHVDVVGVGEDELREAERVAWPRLLPQAQAPGQDAGDVLGRGRESLRAVFAAGHDLHVLAREVAGIAARVGHDLVHDDAVGRVPVGTEDHVVHLVEEDRSHVPDRLADHDVHAHGLLAGTRVGSPQAEEGEVHEHAGALRHVGQPAHALHGQLDLAHAMRHAHVEGGHRVAPDDAVGLEAVAAPGSS